MLRLFKALMIYSTTELIAKYSMKGFEDSRARHIDNGFTNGASNTSAPRTLSRTVDIYLDTV